MMDNKQSERPERRTAFVARELRRLNIDIAALQETRIADEGQLTEVGGGYTFFWKGKSAADQRIHGVGFAIKNEILRTMDHLPIGINERLMTLQIELDKNRKATLICEYAPTLMAENEQKEEFYAELDTLIRQTSRNSKLILLGDFSARVGKDIDTWNGVIEKDGVGNANQNGHMLLTKCAEHKLVITNTLFRQKNRYKTSWRHPRSGHWHLIDYIITRKDNHSDVKMTKAMACSDACWTDHRLIRSIMSFTLKPKYRKTKPNTRPKYRLDRLHQPDVLCDLQEKIRGSIQAAEETQDVTTYWNNLKEAITTSCDETLGEAKRHHEDWFDENDDEITRITEEKRAAFQTWQDDFRNKTKKTNYHQIRSTAQRRVRELKNKWWTDKASELQKMADQNKSREFFAATRKLYGPTSHGVRPVADKEGVLHKEKDKIRECWKDHFDSLLNQNPHVEDNALQNMQKHPCHKELSDEPTIDEVIAAINAMKNGKAVGPDGIPAEIYKHAGPELSDKLLQLFRKIWQTETLPADLRDALIVTIFKKGDKSLCGNYRGISLLAIAGKILARILSTRLSSVAEEVLPESQCGFRPGRGTVDMIFAARQIQEKCREQYQELHMAFIDLTKAFDSVDRESLWKVLSLIGCPEKFIKIVRLLHDDMSASVLVDGEASEKYAVKTGVIQGCVIAPTLFSIFLLAVLHLVRQRLPPGVRIQYRIDELFNLRRLKAKTMTTKITVTELQYADDNAIVANTEHDLQLAMDAFDFAYSTLGLQMNIKKTQVLHQPKPGIPAGQVQKPEILVKGEPLNNVENFTYLGSCLSAKADIDKDLEQRLQAASIAFGRLRKRVFDNKDLYSRTKLKVNRAVIMPTLLYASEAWVTYSRNIKSLEEYHQRCLRRILNIKWTDKCTHNSVHDQSGIPSVESYIISNKLRWAGHVVRMDNDRLPKQIMYGELCDAKRKQGGQRKRFKDNLKHNLKQCHINPDRWEDNARNRPLWRSKIKMGVKIFEDDRKEHREELRAARKLRQESSSIEIYPHTFTLGAFYS